MIYTVTVNPNIDYYMTLRSAPALGAINRAASESCFAGGKGINVSIMLTRLGIENRALGFTAGFVGEMLEKMLAQEGCACDFVRLPQGETRINVKLTGENETAFNGCGPALDVAAEAALLRKLDALESTDVLVLSGNVQPSARELFAAMMRRAKDAGAALVVDTEGDALRESLQFAPLLIKPNREELSALTGRPLTSLHEVCRAAKSLQSAGARNVLVSMGADGALLIGEDGVCRRARSAKKGNVLSTVGAGDSMVAGFLAGLLRGGAETALRMGTAAGTATAFAPILAEREAVLRLYEEVKTEEIEF